MEVGYSLNLTKEKAPEETREKNMEKTKVIEFMKEVKKNIAEDLKNKILKDEKVNVKEQRLTFTKEVVKALKLSCNNDKARKVTSSYIAYYDLLLALKVQVKSLELEKDSLEYGYNSHIMKEVSKTFKTTFKGYEKRLNAMYKAFLVNDLILVNYYSRDLLGFNFELNQFETLKSVLLDVVGYELKAMSLTKFKKLIMLLIADSLKFQGAFSVKNLEKDLDIIIKDLNLKSFNDYVKDFNTEQVA